MSYNLLAISNCEPDWRKINSDLFNPNGPIEMFPIEEGDGQFYLGLSIPSSKLDKHPNTWEILKKTISTLQTEYNFRVFDLYGGFYIEEGNLPDVKKQLIGE